MLMLIAYAQSRPLNANARLSNEARGLNDNLWPCLRPYFVYASGDAIARLRRYACSSERPPALICDKYPNLIN